MFDNVLKYPHVCQKANTNRQQTKFTFQFACRKPQRGKLTGQQTQEWTSVCVYAARFVYCLLVKS